MNRTVFAVRLFGGFQLQRDDVIVDVPLSTQRLLGFLALQDRALARGFVAASLWPDTTDEKAAANLRTALWRLHRPELGQPDVLVVTSHGHLALAADVWVDARELRLAARAQRRAGVIPGDDLLIDVRGELLPGCWDSWLVFERERLRQETVHLCEACCAAALAADDTNRAVLYALAAVEADPLRESANIWVLRAHLAAGNRAQAVRHARAYAALLRNELGIDPPADVDDLLWARPVALSAGATPA